jgi:hypothetical protein
VDSAAHCAAADSRSGRGNPSSGGGAFKPDKAERSSGHYQSGFSRAGKQYYGGHPDQIQAEVETPDGKKFSDNAAPAVDAPRYVEAFPPLAEAKADWIKEDLKIPTKTSYNGVAIFSYPVDKATFDKRKQVTLRIQLYDRPTLVATNTPTPAP